MRLFLFAASLLVVCAAATEAAAACSVSPSPTAPCVTHNGSAYQVDTGSGYQVQPKLTVAPNVQLTFGIDSSCAFCGSHPLYISTSSSGGGAGFVAGGITSGSFTFTPTLNQLQGGLYYQCQIHAAMGGQLVDGSDAGVPDAGSDGGTDGGSDGGGSTDAAIDATTDSGTDAALPEDAATDDAATDDAATQDAASDTGKPDAGLIPQTDDKGGCAVAFPGHAAGAAGVALAFGLAVLAGLRRRRR